MEKDVEEEKCLAQYERACPLCVFPDSIDISLYSEKSR